MINSEGKRWLIGAVAALLSFLVTQTLQLHQFVVSSRAQKTVEMIRLAKELNSEFYKGGEDKTFIKVRMTIEACKPLYDGYQKDGQLNRDEINRYLNFLNDVGFYVKKGALDIDIVDQFFGAHIIEAYESNEIRKYMHDVRTNFKQRQALEDFERVALALEDIPERKELKETYRLGCAQK